MYLANVKLIIGGERAEFFPHKKLFCHLLWTISLSLYVSSCELILKISKIPVDFTVNLCN